MSSVVKGNRPLRFFAIMMVVLIVVAHFLGQINLTENWIFWIMLAMAANAIQASFSGFCPMFKTRAANVLLAVSCATHPKKPAVKKPVAADQTAVVTTKLKTHKANHQTWWLGAQS